MTLFSQTDFQRLQIQYRKIIRYLILVSILVAATLILIVIFRNSIGIFLSEGLAIVLTSIFGCILWWIITNKLYDLKKLFQLYQKIFSSTLDEVQGAYIKTLDVTVTSEYLSCVVFQFEIVNHNQQYIQELYLPKKMNLPFFQQNTLLKLYYKNNILVSYEVL